MLAFFLCSSQLRASKERVEDLEDLTLLRRLLLVDLMQAWLQADSGGLWRARDHFLRSGDNRQPCVVCTDIVRFSDLKINRKNSSVST